MVMGALTMEPIRRRFFEVFYYSHLTLLVPSYVFSAMHATNFGYCIIAPALLYVVDRAIRVYRRCKYSTSDGGRITAAAIENRPVDVDPVKRDEQILGPPDGSKPPPHTWQAAEEPAEVTVADADKEQRPATVKDKAD